MIAALSDREHEEAVVKQSALDGLAALESKVSAERPDVIRALAAVLEDRNPRVAQNAREILKRVYKATPAEMEEAQRPLPKP